MALQNQTFYENKIWHGRKTEPIFEAETFIGSKLYEALKNKPQQISQVLLK